MTLDEILWQCFLYFAHLDESNAALHCAPVRYSPITFRLAEHLSLGDDDIGRERGTALLDDVLAHSGRYAEDTGR